MEVEELRVKLDNTDVLVIKLGKGLKNFVILPGLTVTSFDGLGPAIANQYKKEFFNDYTCYLISRKTVLPKTYSIKEVSEDTYKVIKELGINKADFLGISMGGMISMSIAIAHPEIANKIVLGSATPSIPEKFKKNFSDWVTLAEKGDAEKLCCSFGEKVYTEEFYKKFSDAFSYIAMNTTKENLAHFLTLTHAVMEFDVSKDLSKISCPVLYMGSRKDKIFPAGDVEKIFDNSGLTYLKYLYDGYSHAVYDEAPDFCHRIKEFLDK